MKKLFIIFTFVFALLFNGQSFGATYTLNENISQVVHSISLYKQQNYLQCISDLSEYVKKYPNSAAAHYYLGSAYMRLGLLEQAKEHYSLVAEINSVLQLTSYSLQAIECMNSETGEPCVYYALTKKQISEMIVDPEAFLTTMKTAPKGDELAEGADPEIENLIKGKYPDKMHPDAALLLRNERDKQKRYNMNKKPVDSTGAETQSESSDADNVARAHSVHSFAPSSNSSTISADEMQLIIQSETAALKK